MNAPKNIIFDLGGIFISLDYHRTKQSFINLGAKNIVDYFVQANSEGLLRDFEKGHVSAECFREGIRKLFSLTNVDDQAIDYAWNSMLLGVVSERIELLETLKQDYRLFLFSNINEIHEHGVRALFHEAARYEEFLRSFERVYYSHRVGFRKPDRESFEAILVENALQPQETLFIDDMLDNLLGAHTAGLATHQLLPGDCLISAVQRCVADASKKRADQR